MTWKKTAADRARDAKVYGSAEYKQNRKLALRRAGGRCEMTADNGRPCGSKDRVQVDHIIPATQDGTHHLDNLRVLCKRCHDKKTAQEGRGYRRGNGNGRGRRRNLEPDPVLATRTKW